MRAGRGPCRRARKSEGRACEGRNRAPHRRSRCDRETRTPKSSPRQFPGLRKARARSWSLLAALGARKCLRSTWPYRRRLLAGATAQPSSTDPGGDAGEDPRQSRSLRRDPLPLRRLRNRRRTRPRPGGRRRERASKARIATSSMPARRTFAALAEEEPGTFYLTDFLVRHFDALVIRGLGLDRFPSCATITSATTGGSSIWRSSTIPIWRRRPGRPPNGLASPMSAASPALMGSGRSSRRDANERRVVASLIILYWRDIPSQVIVKAGRVGQARALERFIRAIDAAAMHAGAKSADAYLMIGAAASPILCGDDLESEAATAADGWKGIRYASPGVPRQARRTRDPGVMRELRVDRACVPREGSRLSRRVSAEDIVLLDARFRGHDKTTRSRLDG